MVASQSITISLAGCCRQELLRCSIDVRSKWTCLFQVRTSLLGKTIFTQSRTCRTTRVFVEKHKHINYICYRIVYFYDWQICEDSHLNFFFKLYVFLQQYLKTYCCYSIATTFKRAACTEPNTDLLTLELNITGALVYSLMSFTTVTLSGLPLLWSSFVTIIPN